MAGSHNHISDFNPGAGVEQEITNGGHDMFVLKMALQDTVSLVGLSLDIYNGLNTGAEPSGLVVSELFTALLLSPESMSTVWVTFGLVVSENGTESYPFNSLLEAEAMLDTSGPATIKFDSAGSTTETITLGNDFNDTVTLDASNGVVSIGGTP